MKQADLKIEWLAVEKLTCFENNSKIHTKSQIEHIANSIKQFGFNDPLAISGEDNTILEGNGRIEAAKLLGITTLPCVRLDHLNAEEQRAYVIAHNALCLETGFDEAALFAVLEALQNFDFSDFGVETEKYLQTIEQLQKRELKPIQKTHYLVCVDVEHHDQVVDSIAKLRNTKGVDIFETCN